MAPPLAIKTPSPSNFLTYCITRTSHSPPSSSEKDILIICSTRTTFLREILTDLHVPLDTNNIKDEGNEESQDQLTASQQLVLHTPISALLTTDSISVVYCPTIHHLRAFFASPSNLNTISSNSASTAASASNNSPKDYNDGNKNGSGGGYIAIHGLLLLHAISTEWSAQGLSRSLATIIAAVSSSTQTPRELVISLPGSDSVFGIDAKLPLVNSRMMNKNNKNLIMKKKKKKERAFYGGEGFEDDESGFGGTIDHGDEEGDEEEEEEDMRFIGTVRDVVQRWFKVVEMDEIMDDAEEDMLV
ncbi:hypothetical protein TWF730_000824 [Orbilia blumenaviensis]|uniref:Uncharacterized protein n=1 Tax=Orbilia blumenaviensis TaxID=1796055 RepID=A0AAV9VNV1_9PEZI